MEKFDPILAEQILSKIRREEAAWRVCRKMLGVNPDDAVYLLGPKKRGLKFPENGRLSSYRPPAEGEEDNNEEGKAGGNPSRFQLSAITDGWNHFQKVGGDAVKELSSSIGRWGTVPGPAFSGGKLPIGKLRGL